MSSKFIILRFSVTFLIRVVKQLLVSRVVSKSAVQRSICMDKTRVYFFLFFLFAPFKTTSSCCLFIRRGETDLNKPLIKGIPRYNEAECIPRRTYIDMFRVTNPCYLRTHFSRQTPAGARFIWIPLHV